VIAIRVASKMAKIYLEKYNQPERSTTNYHHVEFNRVEFIQ